MALCSVYAFSVAASPFSASYFALSALGFTSMVFYKKIDAQIASPNWIQFSRRTNCALLSTVLFAFVYLTTHFVRPAPSAAEATATAPPGPDLPVVRCNPSPPPSSNSSCAVIRNSGQCAQHPGFCEHACGTCGPYVGFSIASATFPFRNGAGNFFLNGVNRPWQCLGCDFGFHDFYDTNKAGYERDFRHIHGHSGNFMRFFLYGSLWPEPTTVWDENTGKMVNISTTLIADLQSFLKQAERNNVYVLLVLVNGARELIHPQVITNMSSLESFIDVGVTPVVKALTGYPALLGYDIINEPEGMAGDLPFPWVEPRVQMADIQRFVGRVAHAIHQANPDTLVSCVYVWNDTVLLRSLMTKLCGHV